MKERTTTKVFRLLAGQGMSFADLSRQTGLHVRTLHNVANGNSRSRRARRRIEAALGVPIEWAATDAASSPANLPQP